MWNHFTEKHSFRLSRLATHCSGSPGNRVHSKPVNYYYEYWFRFGGRLWIHSMNVASSHWPWSTFSLKFRVWMCAGLRTLCAFSLHNIQKQWTMRIAFFIIKTLYLICQTTHTVNPDRVNHMNVRQKRTMSSKQWNSLRDSVCFKTISE